MLKRARTHRQFDQDDQPPLGGCVLKPLGKCQYSNHRLSQPPLGGCVLKQNLLVRLKPKMAQPPLGGCVLKRIRFIVWIGSLCQPPLGGCVLKRY